MGEGVILVFPYINKTLADCFFPLFLWIDRHAVSKTSSNNLLKICMESIPVLYCNAESLYTARYYIKKVNILLIFFSGDILCRSIRIRSESGRVKPGFHCNVRSYPESSSPNHWKKIWWPYSKHNLKRAASAINSSSLHTCSTAHKVVGVEAQVDYIAGKVLNYQYVGDCVNKF